MDNTSVTIRSQIEEDIESIQKDYSESYPRLADPDYAFNYWVLSRLYNLDEELCIDNIVDGAGDKGLDCFVHYDELKELHLIQNKYYSDSTRVTKKEFSHFLSSISILLANGYKRSDLQMIFNRARKDSDYKIFLHFYVTNDIKNDDIDALIKNFSYSEENIKAFVSVKYHPLTEIGEIYWGERWTDKKTFIGELPTRVKGTSMGVFPEEYGLDYMIPFRFIMVNVVDLYNMYKRANEKKYELFEKNIREFLGRNMINNGIIRTLTSDTDRENFFYYNNGLTITCDKCEKLKEYEATKISSSAKAGFRLTNPQIINGCQTINSIFEVLSHRDPKDYEKVHVLVKIYVFDEKSKETKKQLAENIVRYTNTQNSIDGKAFAVNHIYFTNLQKEFEKRGFLLLVKKSDKNTFKKKYKKGSSEFRVLSKKSNVLFEFFDRKRDNDTFDGHSIPLDKMLKALLAFCYGAFYAFTRGKYLQVQGSTLYSGFSLRINDIMNIDNMIKLYFLYKKVELDQKRKIEGNQEHKLLRPYNVLGFLGEKINGFGDSEPEKRNELLLNEATFKRRNEIIKKLFSDKEIMNEVYNFYREIVIEYTIKQSNNDINTMVKKEVNMPLFNDVYDTIHRSRKRASANLVLNFLKNCEEDK